MQITCLNAWGGALSEAVLPYLAGTAPDVVCLQEVVHTPGAPKPWLTYRDGAHVLPQRAAFFDELCAVLPDHVATFCPAARGVLWDGDRAVPSYWGLATFVHRALSVIGQVQGFVHKDFSADGYGAHPRSRSAHAVRLFDPVADRVLSVTHMHGLRDLDGKMDTPARAAQAQRLLQMSQQVTEPDALAVICGDFNVEADSATLTLLRAAGFEELVTSRGFAGTRTARYIKPGKFADYMLINQAEAVVSFDVVRAPEVSDHCPLVLTL